MDITQLRNFSLKVIFLVHFVFISLSTLGGWHPSSYIFYNAILITLLLWGMVSEQEEPIQMAIVVNGFAIVLDVFVLIFNFPDSSIYAKDKFSVAMAILYLIVRPLTCIYMIKINQQRMGASGPITSVGDIFQPPRDTYEDIDSTPHPQSNQGGYNFATAQQI